MSAYYVLALRDGKLLRYDAETLPEAQKLMRKNGPSAATFVGTKCFGSLPGIPSRTLDTLILHARGGAKGECAFCDSEATDVADGDPVCAKHREMDPSDRHPEEEHEAAPEDDVEGDGDDEEPVAEDPPRPAPPPTPARPTPPSVRPKAPAEGRCKLYGCGAAIGGVRGDTRRELVGFCAIHRSRIVSASKSCGGDLALAQRRLEALARAGLAGATDPRVIREVYEREGLLVVGSKAPSRSPKPARSPSKPAPPRTAPTRPSAPAPARVDAAAPTGSPRDVFELMLRDHDLVEAIGRDLCVALATRIKGGAS